jgi:hypothetical protein
VLERIKKAFDPDNRLAPLPWQTAASAGAGEMKTTT